MKRNIRNIIVLGGGSAGWLTAAILSAEWSVNKDIRITLIESPNIKHLGVGEGTWPSMRSTLQKIGISESEFLMTCDASFKQGSQFNHWFTGQNNDKYIHPFSAPCSKGFDLSNYWLRHKKEISFANAVNEQAALISHRKAPKQITTPEYAFVNNYGYHLDAGKFVKMLRQHCINNLSVRHILDDVIKVNSNDDTADITGLVTKTHGIIDGDLFIDCTGFKSMLIGGHYKIPFKDKSDVLINDTALAIQVPYTDKECEIASATLATAQNAGWIWDIGLQSRRGVGYVYSSKYATEEDARHSLIEYVKQTGGQISDHNTVRKIPIKAGYREQLWYKNCVAVGISGGFMEPLEASALVMVELAANYIAEHLPKNNNHLSIIAKRFNKVFTYRWEQVVEFIKLHYILSERSDTPYWIEMRDKAKLSDDFLERLELWKNRVPSIDDFSKIVELFPTASYQYILYGMDYPTELDERKSTKCFMVDAEQEFERVAITTKSKLSALDTNRELLRKIEKYGLQSI